eukprot:scaffold92921_cov35-Prasinocladus_malaysianus.AAC.2
MAGYWTCWPGVGAARRRSDQGEGRNGHVVGGGCRPTPTACGSPAGRGRRHRLGRIHTWDCASH